MIKTLFGLSIFLVFVHATYVKLPGFNGSPEDLKLRTGYVDLENGRHVFFWLFGSRNSPNTDPLVVWFQGGPGCSSSIGLFTENGPLVPDTDGGISIRDLSWVKTNNMLFVDQPAGVGYSYADQKSGKFTNDTQAAIDNKEFLEKFVLALPEFKGRDLWLSGESYAGNYIPYMTSLIVQDKGSTVESMLKGIMVGNPVFNCDTYDSQNGAVEIAYWHGLSPYSLYKTWVSEGCTSKKFNYNTRCTEIYAEVMEAIGGQDQPTQDKFKKLISMKPSRPFKTKGKEILEPINPDHLFYDFCIGNGTLEFASHMEGDPNCVKINLNNLLDTYLNRADVKAAVGAQTPYQWASCTGPPALYYTPNLGSTIPLYHTIFNNKPELKVLIYSGDQDGFTCPMWNTQACLDELSSVVTLKKKWHQWTVRGVFSGYYEVYDRYTYATVRGAGHEVPTFQPYTSFALITRFMADEELGEYKN